MPKHITVTDISTANITALTDGGETALHSHAGGAGAVDSVNTQTGVVVLDADDISDAATTNKFVTAADITKLGNLSGTNTGDQTLPTSVDDLGPSQTGNSGKYLTTDGTNASWGTVSSGGLTHPQVLARSLGC